jgi:hypothetical protein
MSETTLTRGELNRALLARHMLLAREKATPLNAVERLVGLQAQQARPPFVGLWTRLASFERDDLVRLLKARKIVRSTLMRATLHLMTAKDYVALRGAVQPCLSAGMRAVLGDRASGFEVESLLPVARGLFEERPRTFNELRAELVKRFPTANDRALGYAVRTHLPLVTVPDGGDWGYRPDSDFAVAETWLGEPVGTDEKPHALVLRYLAAFGPATAADVQTWSGLGGLKGVLDELRPKLAVFRDERKREMFDLPKAPRPDAETPAPVRFVPEFDNLILAHADRSRVIADEWRPRVVTKNLQVAATFLVDGFVAGTWKVAVVRKVATLTVSPFAPLSAKVKEELAAEGERLVRFVEPGADRVAVAFGSAAG